jgi:hypothetical protein
MPTIARYIQHALHMTALFGNPNRDYFFISCAATHAVIGVKVREVPRILPCFQIQRRMRTRRCFRNLRVDPRLQLVAEAGDSTLLAT